MTGVVGKAGTGKTRMMRATVDALQSESGTAWFSSSLRPPRPRAACSKRKDSRTPKRWRCSLKTRSCRSRPKGRCSGSMKPGLVSAKDMRRLMDVAKKNGNRVILSGDYTQHSSVEAGDAFRLLEKEAGVRLAKPHRDPQADRPGYKKAVEAIAKGTRQSRAKGIRRAGQNGLRYRGHRRRAPRHARRRLPEGARRTANRRLSSRPPTRKARGSPTNCARR